MAEKKKILIIEDDADIVMIKQAYLEAAGYAVVVNTNGLRAAEQLEEEKPDLVLLDLMLPSRSGYDICQELREKTDIPLLMVTARSETVDKVRGFGTGADDYIAKPFDPAELVARVTANLKQYERLRGGKKDQESAQDGEIRIGDLRILVDSWKVYKGNEEVRLSGREFELLRFMAENPNMVFSKEQLLEKVWGYDYTGESSTVMVHINRLREKLEDDPRSPRLLETVWGIGYRLNR